MIDKYQKSRETMKHYFTDYTKLLILVCVFLIPAGAGAAELLKGFGGTADFGQLAMGKNDDGSSGYKDLSTAFPNGLNFFGKTYTGLYINNNGNVTFHSTVNTFTPSPFPISSQPMIAPFWGDVDTRGAGTNGSNNVYYNIGTDKIVITWFDVGYYSAATNKLNNFQLILTSREDTGVGNFDVEFRYEKLQWTTGNASGGSNGLGGTPAQVGFDAGNQVNFYAHEKSRTAEVLELVNTSNVGVIGVWRFEIREGQVIEPPKNMLRDVVAKITLPAEGVSVNETTFQKVPDFNTISGSVRTLEWRYETISVDQIEDLSFDVILHNPVPGENRKVSYGLILDYIDVNENPVHVELSEQVVNVLTSRYTGNVSTNASSYPVSSDVLIQTELMNIGTTVANGTLTVAVYDISNNLVAIAGQTEIVNQAAGESINKVFGWNTGAFVAGDYYVLMSATDAVTGKITNYRSDFRIHSGSSGGVSGVVGTHISTDKQSYHTSDQVWIESSVSNKAANATLPETFAKVVVSAPDGVQVFAEVFTINALAVNASLKRQSLFDFNQVSQGLYTVTLTITDEQGVLLDGSSANFEVVEDTRRVLSGSAKAVAKSLYVSQQQICESAVSNISTTNLSSQLIKLSLVNVDTKSVVNSQLYQKDLSVNDNVSLVANFETTELKSGNYACVLEAYLDNSWVALDAAPFKVLLPIIKSELASNLEANALILVDGLSGLEPGKSENAPDLEGQIATLEQALENAGVHYTIVDDVTRFNTELYSGHFNTYLLLSEGKVLAEREINYITGRVFAGHSLFVAGQALPNNPGLELALGIELADITPQTYGIQSNTGLMPSISENWPVEDVNFSFHPISATVIAEHRLANGAQWHYQDTYQCVVSSFAPAVSVNSYGKGKGYYASYDLMMQGAKNSGILLLNENSFKLYQPDSYLLDTKEEIHFRAVAQSEFPAVGRLQLKVSGVELINTDSFVPSLDNHWSWEFNLAMNFSQTSELSFYAPESSVNTEVYVTTATLDIDEWHKTKSWTIPLKTAAPVNHIRAAQQKLDNLNQLDERDFYLKFAQRALTKALPLKLQDESLYTSKLLEVIRLIAQSKASTDDIQLHLTKEYLTVSQKLFREGK